MSPHNINYWMLIAGLGLFLFGLSLLETGLKFLAGPTFRKALRDYTKTPTRSTIVGTLATMILQSSSVVNLILLAFVGAGILTLNSALGIVYGSNLGTTFTGWIVAWIGFKVDYQALTLPFIAVGSLILVYTAREKRLHNVGLIILGFGFLLMGLTEMKTSVETLTTQIDLAALREYSSLSFVIFGVIFTAIIQSSSATLLLTLSSLSSGIIDLPQAAAIVIGANLGTTGTVLIGALQGTSDKKRVALSHLVFNLFAVVITFTLLTPMLRFIQNSFSVDDPIYTLVLFHSCFNFLPILFFLPVTNQFARLLESLFIKQDETITEFIHQVNPRVVEAAAEAVRNETRRIIDLVIEFDLLTLGKHHIHNSIFPNKLTLEQKYRYIKENESEILSYIQQIQINTLDDKISATLAKCLHATRMATLSAKSLKDVQQNILEFRDTDSNKFVDFIVATLDQSITELSSVSDLREADLIGQIYNMAVEYNNAYAARQKTIYESNIKQQPDIKVTALNLVGEIRNSFYYLVNALAEITLSQEQLQNLESLPSPVKGQTKS